MTSAIAIEQVSPVFYYRPKVRTFKVKPEGIAGLLCSIGFHVALLVVTGMVLIKPADFAVDQGLSGMELQLVAGVEELTQQPVPVSTPGPVEQIEPLPQDILQTAEEIIPFPQDIKQAEQLTVKEPQKIIAQEIKAAPVPEVVQPEPVKPVVKGNSPVNMTSTGSGALTEVKPVYLSNPAPKYPSEARRKGWEGTVVLRTSIGKNGYPFKLELEKTSGYAILDETALKTVKTWQFRPAYIGDMPIESTARVPVRFELNEQ